MNLKQGINRLKSEALAGSKIKPVDFATGAEAAQLKANELNAPVRETSMKLDYNRPIEIDGRKAYPFKTESIRLPRQWDRTHSKEYAENPLYPGMSEKEEMALQNLGEYLDEEFGLPASVEDLTDEDETYTIKDVIRPYARRLKMPTDKLVELWLRGSKLNPKSTWGEWVRYNNKE